MGPTGPAGPAGASAESIAVISFASQQAAHVHTNAVGIPTDTALIGYGYMEYSDPYGTGAQVAIHIDPEDGHFDLSQSVNRQLAFSLPFDMTLDSITVTAGCVGKLYPPYPERDVAVYPYIQIYTANAGSNTFFPLPGAFAKPASGILPETADANTLCEAHKMDLNIKLPAGTRITIGGMMELPGDHRVRDYPLFFTGGLGMTRQS